MSTRDRIKELQEQNSELFKEVLLNETAIDDAKRILTSIDIDFVGHPVIKKQALQIQTLIKSISWKNEIYKHDIYKNELEITKLMNKSRE